jgi:hypothetical protein
MKITGPLVATTLALSLGGCADYLNRHDTVTLGAGEAQSWNRVVQTTDPWPAHARNTRIERDGQRTARVIRGFTERPASGAAAAP